MLHLLFGIPSAFQIRPIKGIQTLIQTVAQGAHLKAVDAFGNEKIQINHLQCLVKVRRRTDGKLLQTAGNFGSLFKVLRLCLPRHSVQQIQNGGILNLNALEKSRLFFIHGALFPMKGTVVPGSLPQTGKAQTKHRLKIGNHVIVIRPYHHRAGGVKILGAAK